MINSTQKILLIGSFIMLIFLLGICLVSADNWYPGDIHRHTGFSTEGGYEGVSSSECDWEVFDPTGYTIEELKDNVMLEVVE